MGACPGRIPTRPSQAGATTEAAGPSYTAFSADTTLTFNVFSLMPSSVYGSSSRSLGELVALGDHLVDATLHVESLLGEVIELSVCHALERLDGLI